MRAKEEKPENLRSDPKGCLADSNGEHLYFYHSDHLGTPLFLTDVSGTVVWRGEYLPFGEVFSEDKDPDEDGVEVEQPFRFPGQYEDAETGMYYNYFRDYDPKLGRYTEADPIGLDGGINMYGYAVGNPLLFVDENGLLSCTYQIESHTLTCINNRGATFVTDDVKSGKGECQDDPDCTKKQDEGPLPTGKYSISVPGHSTKHPKWLYLKPKNKKQMHGRFSMYIHGWGVTKGCIAIHRNVDMKLISDWTKQDNGGDIIVIK